MRLFDRARVFWDDSTQNGTSHQPRIIINGRSDGLTITGMPSFVAPWVSEYTGGLTCSDGTDLPIRATHTLITGSSENKEDILMMQIAGAIRSGYTPVVLSADGQQGGVYRVLRSIYPETAIHDISQNGSGGYYDLWSAIPRSGLEELFYQIVMTLRHSTENSMLVRNYIHVCIAVLFTTEESVYRLMEGLFDHERLLAEIQRLYQNGLLTRRDSICLENMADSARSVSVAVFSVIQNYLHKLLQTNTFRAAVPISGSTGPRITILNLNGENPRPARSGIETDRHGYNLSTLSDRKCLFFEFENEMPRTLNDLSGEQSFQWYISQTLQMEMRARPEMRNSRILLIVEDLNAAVLSWFWWLTDLPDCVLLLSYKDFYSKMADSEGFRQQLIGMLDRIYFFSVIDEQSASWASKIFGTHMVPKVVVTDQPCKDWLDVFFRPRTYAHDEVEKPWFSAHEIQQLGSSGIVYSKQDKIFIACYCENGKTYLDRNYRGRYVNFCTFHFR